MTCEQLRDEYGAYALGAVEEPERSELRAHLSQGCPNCVPGVREASAVVVALAGSVKLVDPPARLRRRVLAAISGPSTKSGVNWAVVFGACALLFLLFSIPIAIQQASVRRDVERMESEARQRRDESAKLTEALALVNDPSARQFTFQATESTPAHGKIFVVPHRGVVLLAANLPPAPYGKAYEMWTVPKSGNPSPAGVFRPAADGSVTHLRPGIVDPAATAAVAVTVEPEEGSPLPTTKPFIVTPLE